MKPILLISSYGGSGSTYLAHKVRELAGQKYNIYHSHSLPQDDYLGVPVFNRLTGHNEGPLSKYIPLPEGSKVVLIYRSPAEAYLSRCSYKHFLHLWSDTDRITEMFGKPDPTRDEFRALWKEYQSRDEDILGMDTFMDTWRAHAEAGPGADIAFLKYEALGDLGKDVMDFLEVPHEGGDVFSEFSAVAREIPANVETIFAGLQAKLDSWPSQEVFKGETAQPAERLPVKLENASFTVSRLNAGASDVIARLSLCYDVVTSVLDIEFDLPDYRNYHSPELDFFDVYGVTRAYGGTEAKTEGKDEVVVTLTDFIYHALFDVSWFKDNTHYVIDADIYERNPRVEFFKRFIAFKPGFMSRLEFKSTAQAFPGGNDVFKATIHLRRNDICGKLFENAEVEMPKGMHSRELLTLKKAYEVLEPMVPEGKPVEIVVATDGVERLKRRFANEPAIISQLEELERDIEVPPETQMDVRSIERVIGTTPAETLTVLDAIYQSDVVITASSTFPRIAAQLGKTRTVNGLNGNVIRHA